APTRHLSPAAKSSDSLRRMRHRGQSAGDEPHRADTSLLTRTIVLASASPYRAQILRDAGVDFSVLVSDVDESAHPPAAPTLYAQSLAQRKAQAVAPRVERGALVVAA